MCHRGSRGVREHLITPGDARTFANPTCGASARVVDLCSSCVCDFVSFAFLLLFLFVFSLRCRCVRYGSCSCFFSGQLTPRDAYSCPTRIIWLSSVCFFCFCSCLCLCLRLCLCLFFCSFLCFCLRSLFFFSDSVPGLARFGSVYLVSSAEFMADQLMGDKRKQEQ